MTDKDRIAEYVLLLCEKDEISRKKAMFYLNMSYGELLQLMSSRGVAAPGLEDALIDEMASAFVKIHDARHNQLVFLIPDGGPLIRFALADRLDVLLALRLPFHIVDHMRWELTRDMARQDARRIAAFLHGNTGVVCDFETSVGADARSARESDPVASQKGLTMKVLEEVFTRVDDLAVHSGPVLMLFEDWDIRYLRRAFKGDAHLISTKALLVGMERQGLIASAGDIWNVLTHVASAPTDHPEPSTS